MTTYFLRFSALTGCLLVCACSGGSPEANQPSEPTMNVRKAPDEGIYSLRVPALDGAEVDLTTYAGRVSLVVNVASECGYTPQYAGLQQLHEEFGERGFQVLGFPCNDFGGQEPGSAEAIRSFCTTKFGVSFPMFGKVVIRGEGRSPVYARLIDASGETPSWNFCKYLVGKDGRVLGYFGAGTGPDDAKLRAAIERAL